VRRALTDPLEAPPPSGEGAIRGVVRLRSGAPLAEVDVVAAARMPSAMEDTRPPHTVPLEERIAELVRAARWRDEARRVAHTGADGTFELTGIGAGVWDLEAYRPSYRFAAKDGGLQGLKAGAFVELVAAVESGLDLDVTLPDGTRPERASVRLEQLGRSTPAGWVEQGSPSTGVDWSPGRTRITADPGPCRLTVTAGAWDEFREGPLDVTVPSAAIGPALRVTLRSRPGLRVVTRVPEGFDFPRRFRLLDANAAELGTRPQSRGPGEAAWLDLAPGRYMVEASLDGATIGRAEAEVHTALETVTVSVPAPAPARVVEVVVALPSGAASLGEISFFWRERCPQREAGWPAPHTSLGDGRFRVYVPGPRDQPQTALTSSGDTSGSRWWLVLRSDGVPVGAAEYTPGASRVQIDVTGPGWVDVTLGGFAGKGLEGATIVSVLRMLGGSSQIVAQGEPDGQGRVRLGPIEPFPYHVSVRLKGEFGGGTELVRVPFEGRAGTQSVRAEIPPIHRLEVYLGPEHARDFLRLYAAGDGPTVGRSVPILFRTDGDGYAVIGGLLAGTYRLQLGGKTHEIPIPETTVFRP
jgi:hypothetical protein